MPASLFLALKRDSPWSPNLSELVIGWTVLLLMFWLVSRLIIYFRSVLTGFAFLLTDFSEAISGEICRARGASLLKTGFVQQVKTKTKNKKTKKCKNNERESVIWRFLFSLFNVLGTTFEKGFVVTVDDDGDDDDDDDDGAAAAAADDDDGRWTLLYGVVFCSRAESQSFIDRFVRPRLFKSLHNPLNCGKDYMFFNVYMWSFCTCTRTTSFALYCRIVAYVCYCRCSWVIYCVQYDLN